MVGLAGCSAAVVWGTADSESQGGMMGGTTMGSGMMGGGMMGGMMGGGMMSEPMMVWRVGSGPVSSPQDAARLASETVQTRGWTWLTLDEVHIFPAFYEVEFNDRDGFKGPELYVNRSSGAAGPEMGPNMMWDSQYGMGSTCSSSLSEGAAGSLITTPAGLSLGDADRHHGYWEFELKRGNKVISQINISDCRHSVIDERMWQPDMEGTYAPNG